MGGFALTGKIELMPYVEVLNVNPPNILLKTDLVAEIRRCNGRQQKIGKKEEKRTVGY